MCLKGTRRGLTGDIIVGKSNHGLWCLLCNDVDYRLREAA